jgi:hypothetical protein
MLKMGLLSEERRQNELFLAQQWCSAPPADFDVTRKYLPRMQLFCGVP